jgi:hypothetical protein
MYSTPSKKKINPRHPLLLPAVVLSLVASTQFVEAQTVATGGQTKVFKRQWLFHVQPSHSASWEQLQGLLRESLVQVIGGPDASGALTVAAELSNCRQARRVLELAPVIDLVRDAPEQPTQGVLPPDHCRLSADER